MNMFTKSPSCLHRVEIRGRHRGYGKSMIVGRRRPTASEVGEVQWSHDLRMQRARHGERVDIPLLSHHHLPLSRISIARLDPQIMYSNIFTQGSSQQPNGFTGLAGPPSDYTPTASTTVRSGHVRYMQSSRITTLLTTFLQNIPPGFVTMEEYTRAQAEMQQMKDQLAFLWYVPTCLCLILHIHA